MWLLWYKGVADQPEVLLDNRVRGKTITSAISARVDSLLNPSIARDERFRSPIQAAHFHYFDELERKRGRSLRNRQSIVATRFLVLLIRVVK